MLFWEAEKPSLGVVHHLMVLCYHLQHPHLYSPEMLLEARRMLADFVVGSVSPPSVESKMFTLVVPIGCGIAATSRLSYWGLRAAVFSANDRLQEPRTTYAGRHS